MTFLEVVGTVALGVAGLVLVLAAINGAVNWRNGREMRRWPNFDEWRALEELVLYGWHSDERHPRNRLARVAYRKLRRKYGRRTGQ